MKLSKEYIREKLIGLGFVLDDQTVEVKSSEIYEFNRQIIFIMIASFYSGMYFLSNYSSSINAYIDNLLMLLLWKGNEPSYPENGLFSYWLMRGISGEADSNNNNEITNNELHDFILNRVSKTAIAKGQKQNPELFGKRDEVISSWRTGLFN